MLSSTVPPLRPGPVRKSQLSRPQQRLVVELSRVHFGRIENLHVRDGEPNFNPPPLITRTFKMNGQNQARALVSTDDFELKEQVIELLEHLGSIGSGTVKRIEVAHGLPLLMEISETAQ